MTKHTLTYLVWMSPSNLHKLLFILHAIALHKSVTSRSITVQAEIVEGCAQNRRTSNQPTFLDPGYSMSEARCGAPPGFLRLANDMRSC